MCLAQVRSQHRSVYPRSNRRRYIRSEFFVLRLLLITRGESTLCGQGLSELSYSQSRCTFDDCSTFLHLLPLKKFCI